MKINNNKFWKIPAILFGLVLLLAHTSPAKAAAGVSISISGKQTVGTTVSAIVSVTTNGASVDSAAVNLSFPTDMLEVKSLTAGENLMAVGMECSSVSAANSGTLKYMVGRTEGYGDNFTLVTIGFKIKKTGSAAINFNSAELRNNGPTIEASTSGATITVQNSTSSTTKTTTKAATPTPTPIPTPTPAPLAAPAVIAVSYAPTAILDSTNSQSTGIVLTGTSVANSKVALTISKADVTPLNIDATADATGAWSATINQPLKSGTYAISIKSTLGGQESAATESSFVFDSTAKNRIALGTTLPVLQTVPTTVASSTSKKIALPFNMDQNLFFYVLVGVFVLIGVVIVLAFVLKNKMQNRGLANNIRSSAPSQNNSNPGNSVPLAQNINMGAMGSSAAPLSQGSASSNSVTQNLPNQNQQNIQYSNPQNGQIPMQNSGNQMAQLGVQSEAPSQPSYPQADPVTQSATQPSSQSQAIGQPVIGQNSLNQISQLAPTQPAEPIGNQIAYGSSSPIQASSQPSIQPVSQPVQQAPGQPIQPAAGVPLANPIVSQPGNISNAAITFSRGGQSASADDFFGPK